MIFGKRENASLERYACLLGESVEQLLKERGGLSPVAPVRVTKKPLIEYEGRVRAVGLGKFDDRPALVSAVHFYCNTEALKRGKPPLALLMLFIEEEYLPKLMKQLKYPPFDDEDEEAMLNAIGTLANLIAGRFKADLKAHGHPDLEMSHFINYRNAAPVGIVCPEQEYELAEITICLPSDKRIVLELTIKEKLS